MEYISGDTLRHTMSEEGFYPEEKLLSNWLREYFLPVLDGVKAIHDLNIFHRDLKPENILIDGLIPKITDFGLARSSRMKPVTQSMDVKGTAHYMSPEHFFNFRKADQQADIYSLGKILFEAIDGKINEKNMPFKTAILSETETGFFQLIDKIIQNTTAEKKEERIESIDKFRELLLDAVDRLEKDVINSSSEKSNRLSLLHNPKWIWIGIFIAALSVSLMSLWHLMDKPNIFSPPPVIQQSSERNVLVSDSHDLSSEQASAAGTSALSILAEDGVTLRLIPGGRITFPANLLEGHPATPRIDPFYLDETQVTNHQYVEFLNQGLSKIKVEGSVVRGEGRIWLLLGEVNKGYEPIVFRRDRFVVSRVIYASIPVLRVSAYGADAYIRFYKRRLPTYMEWLQALGKEAFRREKSSPDAASTSEVQMHAQMHGQSDSKGSSTGISLSSAPPVTDFIPNQYGIKGLNKMISEWGFGGGMAGSADRTNDNEFVVMGNAGKESANELSIQFAIPRNPWEAHEHVGFRGARSLKPVQN